MALFQAFQQQAQELVALETIVLQTLGEYHESVAEHATPDAPLTLFTVFFAGFEITVDHPHTDVVRCSQLVRGTDLPSDLQI